MKLLMLLSMAMLVAFVGCGKETTYALAITNESNEHIARVEIDTLTIDVEPEDTRCLDLVEDEYAVRAMLLLRDNGQVLTVSDFQNVLMDRDKTCVVHHNGEVIIE